MPDSSTYYVPAISLTVPTIGGTISSGLCSHPSTLTFLGIPFSPAVEINYSKMGKISMSLDNQSHKISKIPAAEGGLFGNIYDRIQYGHVIANIYELEVNISTSAIVSSRHIVKGLVFNASSRLNARVLDLEIKEDKFYYDKIGGVRCTEQCAAPFFSDPKICKVVLQSVSATVLSISRTVLTLTATPSGATLIYNNGYIEKDGLRIKVAHWESGAVFSMSEIAPASWVGDTVTVFTGCDKRIQSCRDIHDNESEFFGLGFNMVDHNALFEEV